MWTRIFVSLFLLAMLVGGYNSYVSSTPSLNGTAPGCGPSGGCHTFQSGILSVTSIGNLQVRLTLTGTTSSVAGELVDSTGTVVAVNNGTSSNPFVLTAPRPGRYTVTGGFKNPTPRRWDSTQITITLTGIQDEGTGTSPAESGLEQNYPNPFNPSTTMVYRVGSRGSVELRVFDVLGREVAILVNDVKEPGTYSVQWDARDMSSGVYFYRLRAGNLVQTRTLNLLK